MVPDVPRLTKKPLLASNTGFAILNAGAFAFLHVSASSPFASSYCMVYKRHWYARHGAGNFRGYECPRLVKLKAHAILRNPRIRDAGTFSHIFYMKAKQRGV